MVINTNTTAQQSSDLLATSSANLAKSLQRLSSGKKIVSPEDDAAGLAVSRSTWGQAAESQPAAREKGVARVRAAFLYPPSEQLKQQGYYSWPGSGFDAEGHHRQYGTLRSECLGRGHADLRSGA